MTTIPLPSDEVLARYDVNAPRYTSYPPVPHWSAQTDDATFRRALARADAAGPEPLSLYVHLPFCRSLCWYCGCNVVISKNRERIDAYLDHLASELDLVAGLLPRRRLLSQLHWGGGTPTQLDEPQIERVWRDITRHFTPTPDAEVAIEVHPALTTMSQLRLLRSLGFNRVSMGLQDFDREVQRVTNRIQTIEQTRACIEEARRLGFHGVNVDLIYGLPLQNAERWQKTVNEVLALAPDRIAVYSFAYVPQMLRHQRLLPASQIPNARNKQNLFRAAFEAFTSAGYVPVGMDHFARATDPLVATPAKRSRNFQGYTIGTSTDLVGIGASAISSVGSTYAQNERKLDDYYRAISTGRLATTRAHELTADDQARRDFITTLMCDLAVELTHEVKSRFEAELSSLGELETNGLVKQSNDRLEVTELGRLFLRNVAARFDPRADASAPRQSRAV